MSGLDSGFIVVGIDGTAESAAALRWALARGAGDQRCVRIVHCHPASNGRRTPGDRVGVGHLSEVMRGLANDLVATAMLVPQPLEVTVIQATGNADAVLARQAHRALMLVLGASDPSVWSDPRRGPIAGPCLRRVSCPVVLVDARGRVVVSEPVCPAVGIAS